MPSSTPSIPNRGTAAGARQRDRPRNLTLGSSPPVAFWCVIVDTPSGRVQGLEKRGRLAVPRHPLRHGRAVPSPRRVEGWDGVSTPPSSAPSPPEHRRPPRRCWAPRTGRPARTACTSTCSRRPPTTAPGAGVDPRRRVHRRLRQRALVRRHQARPARRRRRRHDQLPAWARSASSTSADLDDLRRLGRQRHPRPDRRARVGARQHRGVRRRPRQRHDLRRVGRRHERRHPARHPPAARAVPPGHRPERGRGHVPPRRRRPSGSPRDAPSLDLSPGLASTGSWPPGRPACWRPRPP